MPKVERNDPCPCDSGKKYKKCCYNDPVKNKEIIRASKLAADKSEISNILKEDILVYVLKVSLISMPARGFDEETLWRKIEIKGDQSLYRLHLIIQNAFCWDNDHMFSFYMNNQLEDDSAEYTANPMGEYLSSMFKTRSKPADTAEIRDFSLTVGTEFKYLFDYGDRLIHTIKVENIYKTSDSNTQYPRITETKGKDVEQYHY